jgi:hypothetical protein
MDQEASDVIDDETADPGEEENKCDHEPNETAHGVNLVFGVLVNWMSGVRGGAQVANNLLWCAAYRRRTLGKSCTDAYQKFARQLGVRRTGKYVASCIFKFRA